MKRNPGVVTAALLAWAATQSVGAPCVAGAESGAVAVPAEAEDPDGRAPRAALVVEWNRRILTAAEAE
ncbi:hypothetical protein K8I85_03055, partial [bacterium]|nr:hypothetical protein [bacterium]